MTALLIASPIVEASHCEFSSADIMESAFIATPQATIYRDLEDELARKFLEVYNARKPVSSFVADRVILFVFEGHNSAIITIFHEDCLIWKSNVTKGSIYDLLFDMEKLGEPDTEEADKTGFKI